MSNLRNEPWFAESFRFTVFSDQVIDGRAEEWWGVAAPNGHIQDINQKVKERITVVTGEVDNYRLDVQVQVNRIDFFAYTGNPLVADVDVAFLGRLDDHLPHFIAMMKEWIGKCAKELSINRIAFGGVLRLPVEDENNPYATLSEILPFIQFDKDWKDFKFQINRPANFSFREADVSINVLHSYGIELVRAVTIDTLSGNVVTESIDNYISTVGFDINTAAENAMTYDQEFSMAILDGLSQRI